MRLQVFDFLGHRLILFEGFGGAMPDSGISEERKFLHDLSGPLAALQIHLESLLATAKEHPAAPPGFEAKLEKCLALFEQTTALLAERKTRVRQLSQSGGSGKPGS